MATRRILSIQNGDWRNSAAIVAACRVEPYFGMTYTHQVIDKFVGDDPSMLICLDAPAYREHHGQVEWVGMPLPRLPRRVPRRVAEYLLARRILALIREFRPTHLMLRMSLPIVSRLILRYCERLQIDTLVILASMMTDSPSARRITALYNQPFVFRVGNHKQPSTQSLIACGLDPAKAIAWDWPGQRQAADHAAKTLADPPHELVYAGSLSPAKGVGDLIDAVAILHREGWNGRLILIGSSVEQPRLEEKARGLPAGMVQFTGRLTNDEVFEAMRRATIVVVPSRHEFPEGMPLTLTEGLASRTPVVVSDHPVMVSAFREDEGLRFFRASDPASLAAVIRSILTDPAAYTHLSTTSADALVRVSCPTMFGDLIDQWAASPLASRTGQVSHGFQE